VVKLVCLERFRVIVARGAAPARVRDVRFFTDSERPQLFSEERAVGRFRENRSAEREGRSAKFIFSIAAMRRSKIVFRVREPRFPSGPLIAFRERTRISRAPSF